MDTTTRGRWCALLASVAMLATLLALAPSSPAGAQASGCPPAGGDPAATGPFDVTVREDAEHTYYSPSELGSQGCEQHPVIIWGNGTFTTPPVYQGLLEHWASHGFIVAAANTSNAGTGEEMLAGIDNLAAFAAEPGDRFNGHVDLDAVASTGHSQGAAGAITAAADDRVTTTFPIQGAGSLENVDSALLLAGETDPFAGTMRDLFDSTAVPAAFAELAGAGHLVPLGDGGGFRGASTAWARWQLMGDTDAGAWFVGDCQLCTSAEWSDYAVDDGLGDVDPGPGPGPGDECHTATNDDHRTAGRAEGWLFLNAVGSGDALGLWTDTTSLREVSSGTWELVDAC